MTGTRLDLMKLEVEGINNNIIKAKVLARVIEDESFKVCTTHQKIERIENIQILSEFLVRELFEASMGIESHAITVRELDDFVKEVDEVTKE